MTKIKNIEFFRFLFAIVIVFLHMIVNLHKLYPANTAIQSLYLGVFGDVCVDLFFIISGYFLFFSIERFDDIWSFAIHKLKRLYPVLVFSIITGSILAGKFYCTNTVLNLLLLQNTGMVIGKSINIAAWFVSALFWISIFYAFIIKIFDERVRYFIIILCTFAGYSVIVQKGGSFYVIINSVLSIGMVRAIAGIGCGYLLAVLYKKIGENSYKFFTKNIYNKIVISVVEILLIILLVYLLIFGASIVVNKFIIIVLFIFLFILLLSKSGWLSMFLDNNVSVYLGKYAYSIYMMQACYNIVARKSIWLNLPSSNLYVFLILNILGYILLGMVTYHLIEKPFNNYFKKKEKLKCIEQ